MKNCLQCNGTKFDKPKKQIPGTLISDCQTCYLTNIHDEADVMFGYLKRFSHNNKNYTFYAFRMKDMCILAEAVEGVVFNIDMQNNFKIIDRFPRYVHAYDVRQNVLIDIVEFKENEDKINALACIDAH